MKTKFNGILTLLLAFMMQFTFAQEKTISGTVSDDLGPVSDITVRIKGDDTKGSVTDFDGKYTITAKTGDVLEFTHVSFQSENRIVGASNSINVTMSIVGNSLEEVIITAQGIKRSTKALGYAVSTISSDKIESKPQADISKLLRGNASGVSVVSSGGLAGSGTSVIIRGYSSINGSNQALFVIDGIPFDTSVNTEGSFVNNANSSSRSLDLDPNQIESMSVLKGLSATALYGEQGRNGVILITTKGGKQNGGKTSVTVNQSTFFSTIVLPDYQNTYGGGFYNEYGPFFSNWGSAFADQETIPNAYQQFADLFPERPELAADEVEYRPYDSTKDFFRTGQMSSTSISASGGDENSSFNFGFGHLSDKSFLPGNTFKRTNFSVGGKAKLNNKFTISGKLNYSLSGKTSPMTDASLGSDVVGGGIASIWNILYNPRSVNTIGLPFERPDTNESIWYRGGNDRTNPLWALKYSSANDDTNRFFGNANVNYEISNHFNINYTFGLDTYTFNYLYGINRGSNDGEFNDGYLKTTTTQNKILNHSFNVNYNNALLKNSNGDKVVGLESTIGMQLRRDESKRSGLESRGQAENGFGLLNHGNFSTQTIFVDGLTDPNSTNQYDRESYINQNGIYGSFSFDYKNYLFLNTSIRNDWTSTLESKFNNIFSKSASLSFIPTTAFPSMKGTFMKYLKLRAGWGEAPGFTSAYTTRATLNALSNVIYDTDGNGISINSVDNFIPNSELKPELSQEFEVGLDVQFFNNRLGFNFTYFDRFTENQIVRAATPGEIGGSRSFTNVGKVINNGIEISYNIMPIKTEKFDWNITGNYDLIKNTVEDIDSDIYLGGYSNLGAYAIEGQPFGVILGDVIDTDENGNFLVDNQGYWISTTDGTHIIADPNPDWKLSATNAFRYKSINLSFQVDYQHGGDIFARTVSTLLARGLTTDTDFDRTLPIVLPGVNVATGEVNDVVISSTDAYFGNIGFGPTSVSVYDATFIKLRDVTLSYRLPSKLIEKTPFGGINISLSGQNLFVKAFNMPDGVNYDPEINSVGAGSNARGIDLLTSWNSKKYGLSVKLTF